MSGSAVPRSKTLSKVRNFFTERFGYQPDHGEHVRDPIMPTSSYHREVSLVPQELNQKQKRFTP
jgi:hypothetical protein